jgi:hypothetical protein
MRHGGARVQDIRHQCHRTHSAHCPMSFALS